MLWCGSIGLVAAGALCLCIPFQADAAQSLHGIGIDVLEYSVSIKPDFGAKSISGATAIRFVSLSGDLKDLVFSDNGLSVLSASIDGAPARAIHEDGTLKFHLPRSLRRGQAGILRVAYEGKPARGLTFTPGGVFTSYWACDWMVCSQDAPGDKAVLQIAIDLPKGMKSLAAGELKSVTATQPSRETHVWRTSRPYSPYLFGFAAGPFVEVAQRLRGNTFTYLSETVDAERMGRLFKSTGDIEGFLEGRAGVPLPDYRYAQLLVDGSEAQEAATYSVLGTTELDTVLNEPPDDWAIVHEMAHQWWGNLVTCKNWNELWLNEGLAVFMTAAWKQHEYGEAAYQAELDVARKRVARLKEIGFDKPLSYAGPYPSRGARRAVQYSKAALFLVELRNQLGEKVFWDGLQRYTRAHAGGVVDSHDFQIEFERASHRDLSPVFRQWVYAGETAATPPRPEATAP